MWSRDRYFRLDCILGYFISRDIVDVLHMTAEVTALSECFRALRAFERSQTGVLPVVVPQIATLLEDAVAALVVTLEE